jgi:hypothetical protein
MGRMIPTIKYEPRGDFDRAHVTQVKRARITQVKSTSLFLTELRIRLMIVIESNVHTILGLTCTFSSLGWPE